MVVGVSMVLRDLTERCSNSYPNFRAGDTCLSFIGNEEPLKKRFRLPLLRYGSAPPAKTLLAELSPSSGKAQQNAQKKSRGDHGRRVSG